MAHKAVIIFELRAGLFSAKEMLREIPAKNWAQLFLGELW